MEAALTGKFSEKVAELRKTDPLVDWDGVDKGTARFIAWANFIRRDGLTDAAVSLLPPPAFCECRHGGLAGRGEENADEPER
jgi:hypothetical protein